ncbi:hypothetical protein ACWDXD_23500 [Streptomyces sp. NPDC003314]
MVTATDAIHVVSLTEAGGWPRLAGTAGAVTRTVGIVGLDTGIDCRPTLARALDA